MPVTEFQERVYTLLSQIPIGRVTTYAVLGRALGSSPRAGGNALRNNSIAPKVPCHRCVASNGYVTGYHGEVVYQTTLKKPRDLRAQGKAHQSKTRRNNKGEQIKKVKTISPSDINVRRKLQMLKEEGVEFDDRGMLIDKGRKILFDGPWKV